MTGRRHKPQVVLVSRTPANALPFALYHWLSRSKLSRVSPRTPVFRHVLSAIGIDAPAAGLAALRLLGQTGEQARGWVAAADIVNLEPGMRHLHIHSVSARDISDESIGDLYTDLQRMLDNDPDYQLTFAGRYGYLLGDEPLPTADEPPELISGLQPDDFMPSGASAAAHNRLLSEMQMCLHGQEINRGLVESGQRPANSVWLWGGGSLPTNTQELPMALFADEPLVSGIWANAGAQVDAWQWDMTACLARAPSGFVAVAPQQLKETDHARLLHALAELRDLQRAGHISGLTLTFEDGLVARPGRFDALRFWRRATAETFENQHHD